MAAMALVVAFFFFVGAASDGSHAALVEHTFVVSQVKLNRLCNETLVTVVNGQLPGPAIEVIEGDSVVVHVINESPHGLTIHWHGVKQQLNCWADGAGMITQCPIQPKNNFTYRFDVIGQEGTLWWHAHVGNLRATIHGAFIIRPRSSSYPFPKPDHEIPIVIGEWWEMDLVQLDMRLRNGLLFDMPGAATINGKPGDLYNCAGIMKESNIMNVQHGKTYLLRIVNAALDSEYYFKIAGHMLTVVAADANYVKLYTTDVITISPGETLDALLVANAPHGGYYMVAKAYQPPKPAYQAPLFISRGIVLYDGHGKQEEDDLFDNPMVPDMPDQHDAITSFYFYGNLTSLQTQPLLHQVPTNIDEHLFLALDAAYFCRKGESSCHNVSNVVSMVNNVSFQLPATTSLLQAHYYNNMSNIGTLRELPDRAPRMFDYNMSLEPTSKATSVRRLQYNTTVEIVFQSPLLADSYSNPMHLHGHDFFVLAQGFGKYDAEKDMKRYNLVDPAVRNTVHVPIYGWAAIRFVTKNPGVWYLHCHYGHHSSLGMGLALVVENGATLDTNLPPAPADFPTCNNYNSGLAYE